ncbi:MAG: glycosyltransferase family 39 protein [Limnochordales bacterium]|nr:glycosyltransferase family 39 protein [Limnochordales bacterium]
MLVRLGYSSLWDIDEAIYGEISREMVESGDWVVPHWNYAPRYDKPPLTLWLTAAFIRILGPSELAVRLTSALFGVAGMLLTSLFGGHLFGSSTGWTSGLVLGTSIAWFLESRIGIIDTALSFFIGLTMFAGWLTINERKHSYYLLLWGAAALGTLTKGPVALLLPGSALLLWIGPRQALRELRKGWFWLGVALFVLIAAPWHLAIWQREGMAWVTDYFGYHMLTRFTQPIEEHGEPWFYYVIVILIGFVPWSPLLWFVGKETVFSLSNRARLYDLGPSHPQQEGTWPGRRISGVKLLLWWFGAVVMFFSLSSTKLPGYILPAFIPLAILTGHWLDSIPSTDRELRLLKSYVLGAAVVSLVSLVALLSLRKSIPDEYVRAYRMVLLFPPVLLAGATAAWLVGHCYARRRTLMTAIVLEAVVLACGFNWVVQPIVEEFKPGKPLVLEAAQVATPHHRIVSMLGIASPTFYARRQVRYAHSEQEVEGIIQQSSNPLLLIVPRHVGAQLARRYPVQEIASHSMGVLLEFKP